MTREFLSSIVLRLSRRAIRAVFIALTAVSVQAEAPAAASAKRVSPSAADRLARIDQLLQRYTNENRIPGAVALVLRDGKPIYELVDRVFSVEEDAFCHYEG